MTYVGVTRGSLVPGATEAYLAAFRQLDAVLGSAPGRDATVICVSSVPADTVSDVVFASWMSTCTGTTVQ